MSLNDALRQAAAGHRQRDLAARLGMDQPTISRWLTGASTLSIQDVLRFEQACGRPSGFVFHAAGICSTPVDVAEAIRLDAQLDDAERDILVDLYRLSVERALRRRAT